MIGLFFIVAAYSFTNWFLSSKLVEEKTYLFSGDFSFYVCKAYIHDPPGDHSFQNFTIILNNSEYIVRAYLNISASDGAKVVATYTPPEDSEEWYFTSVLGKDNYFYISETVEKPSETIQMRTRSSIVTNYTKYMGPTRIVNNTIYSGATFWGFRIRLKYKLYHVKIINRFREKVDEYLLFEFSPYLVSEVLTSFDRTVSTLSDKKVYEVFDSAYKGLFEKLIDEYQFNGTPVYSPVYSYENFQGAPISFKVGKIITRDRTLSIVLTQIVETRGLAAKASFVLNDDERDDYHDVEVYQDPFFPCLVFKVVNAKSTNPDEMY